MRFCLLTRNRIGTLEHSVLLQTTRGLLYMRPYDGFSVQHSFVSKTTVKLKGEKKKGGREYKISKGVNSSFRMNTGWKEEGKGRRRRWKKKKKSEDKSNSNEDYDYDNIEEEEEDGG